jgi:hypothetical protein
VALVDELDRAVLREVRVGDDHLLHPVHVEHAGEVLHLPQRAQPVVRPRRERDEADHLDRRVHLAAERVRHVLDVTPRPDQHRPAPVARRTQDQPRHPLVHPAQRPDVRDRERQRRVEDVVARVVLAVDQREDQRDDRDLEERRDDLRDPGPRGARRVEPGAGEEQRGDEVRERDGPPRLLQRVVPGPLVLGEHHLDHQRGEQREEEPEEVEPEEREEARRLAQRLHPQQEGERRRALAAHVDRHRIPERRRRRLGRALDLGRDVSHGSLRSR